MREALDRQWFAGKWVGRIAAGWIAAVAWAGAAHGARLWPPGPGCPVPGLTRQTQAERLALQELGGGRVTRIQASLWAGQPVWLVTVTARGVRWRVMVSTVCLSAVSKMPTPRGQP
jgi:hypothetical protein